MDEEYIDYFKSLDSRNIHIITSDLMESLEKYVNHLEINDIFIETIRKNITHKVSMTVYRGQEEDNVIEKNHPWFSTSKIKNIAKDYFAKNNGHLFTIHLVNVPILDVYSSIPKGTFGYEEEVIVLGGGTFYKTAELNKKGFAEINDHEYETWYSLDDQKPNIEKPIIEKPAINIQRVLEQIPEEEYEFIDTIDDIHVDNITDDLKQAVFKEIVNRKSQT
jgi:hypothetical protein